MNQYDFEPMFDNEIKGLRIAAISMLAFIALVFLIMLCGCAEKEPPPTLDERLRGAWSWKVFHLKNRYNFHAGGCDVYAVIPAQPVQHYAYAYTTEGDTLTMMDLASGYKNRAVVTFKNDTTAVLEWLCGINYTLKRL